MKHVSIPVLVFVLLAMLMIGISAASAQTATPVPPTTTPMATITRTPTATATPTSTPQPAYTFNDYHFLDPSGPWVASSSSVEWSPSRYRIPNGQSISQTISYITDTFSVTISLRLAVPTTSTVDLYMGITKIKSLTITSTRLATYSFTETVTFPKTVKLSVSSGGPVTVDAVGFRRADGAGDVYGAFDPGGAFENPIGTAGSVDISSMADWFTPLNLTPKFTLEFDTNWTPVMMTVARIAATFLEIATPQILGYYIAGRIAIMCVLWLFGFVMQKIGKPIPNTSGGVVVVRDGGSNSRNFGGLPRLPSSGIRSGGRRRRSRW